MSQKPLFGAFLAGAGLIVCIRLAWPGLDGAIAAAVVALIIVAWLGIYYHNSQIKERDRAGDDLYYLGLLLTLVSLIYALVWLFVVSDPEDVQARVYALVGNFGIALVSTVAGILGRILLQDTSGEAFEGQDARQRSQQGQKEEQTALTEATREAIADMLELRRQLREAADAFAHFTRVTVSQADHVKSHTQELLDNFNQRMATTAERQLDDTAAAWLGVADALRTEGERLLGHIDEAVSGATKRTEVAWRGLAGEFDSASNSARQRLDADAEEMARMLNRLATANGSLEALANALDAAQGPVAALAETASSATASLAANTSEALAGQSALAEGAKAAQRTAIESFEAAAAALTEATGAESRMAGILDTLNGLAEGAREQQAASLEAWRDATSTFSEDAREHLANEMAAWRALIDGFKTAESAQALAEETSRLADLVKRLDGLLNAANRRP